MKKFKFRLERLQSLRERTREAKKMALAEAVQYKARVEGQIDHLQEVKAEEKNLHRAQLQAREVVIEELVRARTYDALLDRFDVRLRDQLRQVELVCDERRRELMEAEKGVRILEKIEERQRQRYDGVVSALDRELMDELAILSHQRRVSDGEGVS